jgi:hypothetical protein
LPKGTPKNIIDKLAISPALEDPAVENRLADLGASLPRKEERSPVPLKFTTSIAAERPGRWASQRKAPPKRGIVKPSEVDSTSLQRFGLFVADVVSSDAS